MQYIVYTTDDSFDYNAPWGTDTYYQRGYHGFDYDHDETIQSLESFHGFGNYCYLDDYKANIDSLIKELDLILLEDYKDDDPEATSAEAFEELMEHLRELALEKDAA